MIATITSTRIPAAAKREVEAILKMWREIQYQLHMKHDDAIFGGYGSDFEARSRGGRPGNPTQNRAIRLATDPETRQLERLNGALDRALECVGGSAGKKSDIAWALKMHYLGNNPWRSIAKRFGVSERTTYRWRNEFAIYVWQALKGK